MVYRFRSSRRVALITAAAGLALAGPTAAFASSGNGHGAHGSVSINQINLFSDIPGVAGQTDDGLINPWGLAFTPKSPLWVSEQGTDVAGAYALAPGATTATSTPVNVTFPDSVLPVGGPTGQVANPGTGFVLSDGHPATFIFDTLDGRIEAWNPSDGIAGKAEDKAAVPGAAYTGLAIASTPHGDRLYAANFLAGAVDVFDSAFHQVKLAPWQFRDPLLPKGYVPFNAQTLDGHVFVTYDTINPEPAPGAGPEGIGQGIGAVDEFSTDGRLIDRIATGGPLNAPWGLAIAPGGWGTAAGSLLVGNFGDGRINIFARDGHHFARHATGQVLDKGTGRPFAEPGLWALLPGGGTPSAGGTGDLWFSAGISNQQGAPLEHHGLLGVLRP